LQPYDVLKHDLLLLSKDAVMRLSHSLDPEKKASSRAGTWKTIAPAAKACKEGSCSQGRSQETGGSEKKLPSQKKKKGKG